MKSTIEKKRTGLFYSLIVLTLLTLAVGLSCQKQDPPPSPDGERIGAAFQQQTFAATSSSMSQQEALKRINALFGDELFPVKQEQVQGINKQQFVQWLRSTKIAAAEQQYLQPLLASGVSEFLLLRNVSLLKTGKQATIAMVAVPAGLHSTYTKLVVLTEVNGSYIGRLCSWFYCDTLDPNMCLCLYRIGIVPLASPCPTSECSSDRPCRNSNGQDCSDPNILEVISAY